MTNVKRYVTSEFMEAVRAPGEGLPRWDDPEPSVDRCEFVLASDYDALRADNQRLVMEAAESYAVVLNCEGQVERLRGIVQADLEEKAEAWGEVERLKQELEALRNADRQR